MAASCASRNTSFTFPARWTLRTPSCRVSHTSDSCIIICHPWQKWAADTSATRMAGDVARRCVLFNYGDGLEITHLFPAGEDDWWLSNQMQQNSPTQLFYSNPIDGPANLLTLQADFHRVFDERHFCFVPKVGGKKVSPRRLCRGACFSGVARRVNGRPKRLVLRCAGRCGRMPGRALLGREAHRGPTMPLTKY
ncbi:hypothetical protein QBC36DRAFT_329633 [Triangularia setosa]|uniref:HNH nuclease domain-containing protein n=1 Tax=Triangularia setosa TaxID=2587417 RepID=A0AAN7A8F5_9PEZI|nr:hypothetical protein QBC36DRAFT_329633 [Podospora setosa]